MVLLDAFSLSLGDFVDDDFVTVTSDGSLTSQANVAGVVPTQRAQTLEAFGTVHGQQFVEWIGTGSPAGQTLSLDAGVSGFAIATYRVKKIAIGRLTSAASSRAGSSTVASTSTVAAGSSPSAVAAVASRSDRGHRM